MTIVLYYDTTLFVVLECTSTITLVATIIRLNFFKHINSLFVSFWRRHNMCFSNTHRRRAKRSGRRFSLVFRNALLGGSINVDTKQCRTWNILCHGICTKGTQQGKCPGVTVFSFHNFISLS